MKKNLFVCLAIFIATISYSQNPNLEYKYALKYYNISSYYKSVENRIIPFGSQEQVDKDLRLFRSGLAITMIGKKKNAHELEFSNFSFSQKENTTIMHIDTPQVSQLIGGTNVISSSGSIRYEYIVNFNKKKDKKLVPALGLALNAYFQAHKNMPVISTSFSTSEQVYGFRAFVVPRINYFFSKRFFIDLNIPLCLTQTEAVISKTDNPTIPQNDRNISTIDFRSFASYYSFRVGVGLKL